MYGCSVSHMEAVQFARRKGWKSVIILEDDIKICRNFVRYASMALRDLAKRNWGLFQFGMFLNTEIVNFVTPRLFRIKYGHGAHAFALHEKTYDSLIENYICELDRGNWEKPAHLPFDEYLNNILPSKYESYGSTKLLISQHPGHSDTWNVQVDYRDKIERMYEKIEPEIPQL